MPELLTISLTVVCSVAGSAGFWAILASRMDKKDAKTRMLLGLGHDRIIYLGLSYIERGKITHDELENLIDYLYQPYKDLKGNGSAERIIEEVKKLEVCKSTYIKECRNEEKIQL